MEEWQRQITESITTGASLARVVPVSAGPVDRVASRYPMRIPPYWQGLMKDPGDPFCRQAVPTMDEIAPSPCSDDPFDETGCTPTPGLVHRYPNRVLLLVTRRCAMHCRHCMRKRLASAPDGGRPFDPDRAAAYIRSRPEIREAILSGGDPLMLDDEALDRLLSMLGRAGNIAFLRIHTRMPCALPHRITPSLVAMLRRHAPLVVVTQFNHPAELTPLAAGACTRLVDAGIPVLCQSVLLRGINDDAGILAKLMEGLLAIRVRPYYLHHPDPVRGTAHFRLPVPDGLAIYGALRRQVPGIGLPLYVMDIPGMDGKVPILPEQASPGGDGCLSVTRADGTRIRIDLNASTPDGPVPPTAATR